VDGDNDPADENGHGTHVAGTIGADRGNAVGVAGVADGAPLMPLRVLDAEGSGSVAGLIQAYSYAAASGARVVNLSLGSPGSSQAERDALASLPGVLFVAAAGNGGEDGIGDDNDESGNFPCAYELPNLLCVAASDNNDGLAEFSNFGATSVDLAAPGVNIASTWPGADYSWSSGTSMATPHAAGAAALLWAAAPEASVADVRSALLSGVDAAQAFSGRTATGGRLNALRSLRLVADEGVGSPAPAPPPSGSSGAAVEEPAPAPAPAEPAPGVSDSTAPRLSVSARRRQSRATLLRRGLVARVRCSEACTVRLALRTRRGALTAPARTALASDSTSRRVRVRLTRAGRRAIRRASSLTLVARATDSAGNARTLRLAVRLRR
jgi:subtilisin family serine protease